MKRVLLMMIFSLFITAGFAACSHGEEGEPALSGAEPSSLKAAASLCNPAYSPAPQAGETKEASVNPQESVGHDQPDPSAAGTVGKRKPSTPPARQPAGETPSQGDSQGVAGQQPQVPSPSTGNQDPLPEEAPDAAVPDENEGGLTSPSTPPLSLGASAANGSGLSQEGAGSTDPQPTDSQTLTLEQMVEVLYDHLDFDLPLLISGKITADNAAQYLGTNAPAFEDGVFSEAAVSSVPYSLCLIRLPEGGDPQKAKDAVRTGLTESGFRGMDLTQDHIAIEDAGQYLIIILSQRAQEILEVFMDLYG